MRLRFTELFEVFWLEQRREEPLASSEQVIAELRGKLSAPVSAASIKLHTCWGCGLLSTFVPGRVPWALSTEPKSWQFQSGWDLHRHFAHPPQLHLRLPGQILFFLSSRAFQRGSAGWLFFSFFSEIPVRVSSLRPDHFCTGTLAVCIICRCVVSFFARVFCRMHASPLHSSPRILKPGRTGHQGW